MHAPMQTWLTASRTICYIYIFLDCHKRVWFTGIKRTSYLHIYCYFCLSSMTVLLEDNQNSCRFHCFHLHCKWMAIIDSSWIWLNYWVSLSLTWSSSSTHSIVQYCLKSWTFAIHHCYWKCIQFQNRLFHTLVALLYFVIICNSWWCDVITEIISTKHCNVFVDSKWFSLCHWTYFNKNLYPVGMILCRCFGKLILLACFCKSNKSLRLGICTYIIMVYVIPSLVSPGDIKPLLMEHSYNVLAGTLPFKLKNVILGLPWTDKSIWECWRNFGEILQFIWSYLTFVVVLSFADYKCLMICFFHMTK